MARIPDAELERLKAEVSVERLVETSGIKLTKSGKDRLGKCPFHEDREASLVVTPEKNLFHCFGCGAAGGPIDWVMKAQGVSFRHAAERLKADLGMAGEVTGAKKSLVRVVPSPVAFDADDQALLNQTVDYYQETLKGAPEALAYLKARGIDHPEALHRFKLGYSNRTLGYSLPIKQVKAGAEIRGRLERLGIYRESGHEHFVGSVVIPVLDEAGNVTEVYGRKILQNLRKGTPLHLYLPGPHKGVWNVGGLKASKEVILCEALIDALTFWCAGHRNVTAAYGVEGFTADHLEAFLRYGIERVLIAYDRDEAGDRAAEKLAKRLMEKGMACYRINFPKGLDANAYALKVQPAGKALGLLIRTAEWMGNGVAPKREGIKEVRTREAADPAALVASLPPFALKAAPLPTSMPEAEPEPMPRPRPAAVPSPAPAPPAVPMAIPVPAPAREVLSPLAARPEPSAASPALVPLDELPAAVKPPAPGEELPHEVQGADLVLTFGSRRYRVRGWQKPLSPEVLRVNLMASKGAAIHVDTLDLYQAKARAAFIRQAGLELSEGEETLKRDLAQVLGKVEAMQAEELVAVLAPREPRLSMTEEAHAEALALLKAPDLLPRILQDFEALGVVGEEANKLTGYLATVSRLLDRPLALLIQSASAAGKSSLMDAVLDLVPEEEVVRYSAMSGQSLFYMGDKNLSHKILAIAEEEGAKQASYALKLLQSEGRVTMASTGKHPTTGMLTTHDYTVEGPVMLFLTTTAIDLDEELLNRCLVLTVNESREQTRAIHTLQRQRETLEGLLARTERERLLALHRNAQRLLQSLSVVNPYADQLRFRDDQTRSRRDHVKYLTLIRAIALLHQAQREVRSVIGHGGKLIRYVEVIPRDIELANELAQEVFSRTVDELLPQTRKLLVLLHTWVVEVCGREGLDQVDFQFTRRQAREATGWGDTQVRIHLDRLVELEYLVAHRGRRGQAFVYELLYQGEDAEGRAKLLGLLDGAALQPVPITATSRGPEATSRGDRGPFAGESRGDGGVPESSKDVALKAIQAPPRVKAHIQGPRPKAASYLASRGGEGAAMRGAARKRVEVG